MITSGKVGPADTAIKKHITGQEDFVGTTEKRNTARRMSRGMQYLQACVAKAHHITFRQIGARSRRCLFHRYPIHGTHLRHGLQHRQIIAVYLQRQSVGIGHKGIAKNVIEMAMGIEQPHRPQLQPGDAARQLLTLPATATARINNHTLPGFIVHDIGIFRKFVEYQLNNSCHYFFVLIVCLAVQNYYLRAVIKILIAMRIFALSALIGTLLCSSGMLRAQGAQVEFGKNRVQYHTDYHEWSEYESEHFITYWYGEGRFIGQAAVQIAEQEYKAVQSLMEHRINNKLQLVVYVDLTDLKQSNAGSEEAFTNPGGQTKIIGNKIFVYFDGNHQNLRRQIREGIASVFLDAMLFGNNLQEIVQNAVLLNLPDWYKQGLVAFAGERWNTDLDNRLRDAVLQEDFPGFDRFAEENPTLAGHALWYYISDNFGQNAVANLLYLTRINRSVESGFLYVLGSPYKNVVEVWERYFQRRYSAEAENKTVPNRSIIPIKNKRNIPITGHRLSPNGRSLAYVSNDIGKVRIFIRDNRTKTSARILRYGTRNAFQATDYNYPLMAWNPNGKELGVIYEHKDVIKLARYNLETGKTETANINPQYQRIHSMDYSSPNALVLSATVRGFSDLFLYAIPTTQTERLTDDIFDDLDAAYVRLGAQQGILFASNRTDSVMGPVRLDSVLPTGQFDLFFFDLDTRSKELVRISHTPDARESSPVALDSARFAYISDRFGIANREVGYLETYLHHYDSIVFLSDGSRWLNPPDSLLGTLDSAAIDSIAITPVYKQRAITHVNTDYSRNLLDQHTAPASGKIAERFLLNQRYTIAVTSLDADTVFRPAPTRYLQPKAIPAPQPTPTPTPLPSTPPTPTRPDTASIDIDNYLFQSEFDTAEKPKTTAITPTATTVTIPAPPPATVPARASLKPPAHTFRPGRIVPSRLQFRTDFVTTQMDNSILFEGLESFSLNPQKFSYPVAGILLKANFKDLFEDHELEGGMRLPTNFNGAEYFATYNNRKHRLDQRYSVYLRNNRMSEGTGFLPSRKVLSTILGQYGLRYPLDIFTSLRATATLRQDQLTQFATDINALNTPSRYEQRIGLKLEYVFDNTLSVTTNILNGSRYKFFADFYKAFDINLLNGLSFQFNRGFLGIAGFDARHYQRIGKFPILALRAAGTASFGSQRFLYYLGGVDNWLLPRFDNSVPIAAPGAPVAFQGFAGPLRGFNTNIRNGNSYLLINTELRLPVFLMLSRRIASNFLRNFQLVGFFDAGTAWEGNNPFSTDNPLNARTITNGDRVIVRINYFREPVVAGYGVGVRSMLFGYFIRADYAWGIETRVVQKPKLYIALGLDF
jgi:hypothetical protein